MGGPRLLRSSPCTSAVLPFLLTAQDSLPVSVSSPACTGPLPCPGRFAWSGQTVSLSPPRFSSAQVAQVRMASVDARCVPFLCLFYAASKRKGELTLEPAVAAVDSFRALYSVLSFKLFLIEFERSFSFY